MFAPRISRPESRTARAANPKTTSTTAGPRRQTQTAAAERSRVLLRRIGPGSFAQLVSRRTADPPGREAGIQPPGPEEEGVNGGGAGAAAPVTCDCVPRGIRIANVQAFQNGPRYGHSFDVVVSLSYRGAPAGRVGNDAQLVWRERSDRPPDWYGVAPNTWADLFTLFPNSGTFTGWTRNRARPCPGREVATITDRPAALLDRPRRTIEFDISVRGGGVTRHVRAVQTLVPDGSGGIRRQSFRIRR